MISRIAVKVAGLSGLVKKSAQLLAVETNPTVSYPLFVSDPWLFERAIWIDLATPVTGLGRKKRI